jgi:hypothetical protein
MFLARRRSFISKLCIDSRRTIFAEPRSIFRITVMARLRAAA